MTFIFGGKIWMKHELSIFATVPSKHDLLKIGSAWLLNPFNWGLRWCYCNRRKKIKSLSFNNRCKQLRLCRITKTNLHRITISCKNVSSAWTIECLFQTKLTIKMSKGTKLLNCSKIFQAGVWKNLSDTLLFRFYTQNFFTMH